MSANPAKPPRLPDRFLQWFCADEVLETLQGDLYELYEKRREKRGKLLADMCYWVDVASACRPFAFKRRRFLSNSNVLFMYNNYFKIAWRTLLRNKAYSALNISGLAVGMASSILILLWVLHELSYDKFHTQAQDIYRIVVDAGNGFKAATNPAGMAPGLADEMPEIKSFVRVYYTGEVLLQAGDRKFEEKGLYLADSNFLDVFSFPLLEGDRRTALAAPQNIVLSRTMAEKYFGDEPAVGKTLRAAGNQSLVVSGVLADVPSNSHLQFDFIVPMSNIAQTNVDIRDRTWDNFEYYSYLQFQPEAISTPEALAEMEKAVNRIFATHISEFTVDFHLQALTDIHLKSDYQMDLAGHGNILYVNSMLATAIFILLVACINFMNLATARSAKRAREVGVRKVIGARKQQLVAQFMTESVIISLLSLVLSIGIVYIFLPVFNTLAGKPLNFDLLNGRLLGALMLTALLTGLLSGSYPSLFLSSYKPLSVLSGKLKVGGGNRRFRNVLVVMQLVISVVLIVGAGVTRSQLSFLRSKNLGFDQSNLLYMPFKGEIWNKQDVLRTELAQHPATHSFSIVSDLPSSLTTGTVSIDWEGKDPNMQIVVPNMNIDHHFLDVMGIELLQGRGFSGTMESDKEAFVINEKAAEMMGFEPETIIGTSLSYAGQKGPIIGVVKNFNFKPLQYAIEPLVLRYREHGMLVVIKTPAGSTEQTISRLEAINEKLNPSYPLSFSFLDRDLENQYRGEQRMGSIFNLFAVLAILISCLGLYGLSAFVAEQSTKQIGIRKVLGANTFRLVNLLTRDFLRLILIALLVAIPASWYLMERWLNDFAYRVDLHWWMFAVAGCGVILITLLTVSYHVVKAALADPVSSLRSE